MPFSVHELAGEIFLRDYRPLRIVFTDISTRIDSIKKNGMEWVKELGKKNVEDLITMIQWNEENVRCFESLNDNFELTRLCSLFASSASPLKCFPSPLTPSMATLLNTPPTFSLKQANWLTSTDIELPLIQGSLHSWVARRTG
jgi:hypothetical protein